MIKRVLILLSLLLITLLLVFFALFRGPIKKEGANPIVTPTLVPIGRSIPQEKKINALQKVEIGITTEREIEKIPGIELISKTGNQKTYSLPSVILIKPHIITTDSGVAKSEQLVLPAYNNEEGYTTLTSIIRKYGKPEEIIEGSSFFGDFADRYLYPQRGFTIIVNVNTDEVFEIKHFKPISLAEYKTAYPGEVKPLQKKVETH